LEHENRDLERLQREVFYFKLLSLDAREEYPQIISLAEPWLRENGRYRNESAYQGVQFELAKAFVKQGEKASDDRERQKAFLEANRLFDRLGGSSNPYTGLARREQIKL